MKKQYFHVCANGADARNFIICQADYFAAFNLVAVCAANTQVVVVSFSLEDSHPHFLLWGTEEACLRFKILYERLYTHHAAATRKGGSELVLRCELYPIGDDQDYLLNVAVYTVIQATKDGKAVMPYDYPWGTGCLVFRKGFYVLPWLFDAQGNICRPVPFGSLGARARRKLLHTREWTIPDNWLVCNGLILPTNYVDVARFESIYGTHNRFRVFLSSPKQREEAMLAKMAEQRGVMFEDQEARILCGDTCKQMFGTRDPRRHLQANVRDPRPAPAGWARPDPAGPAAPASIQAYLQATGHPGPAPRDGSPGLCPMTQLHPADSLAKYSKKRARLLRD